MAPLLDKINLDLREAIKKGKRVEISVLRFLLSAIKNYEIEKYPPVKGGSLTDEDVIRVLQKQVKSHKESIEMFEKGGRVDLVEKEKAELSVLLSYLPETLSEEEVRQEVERELKEMKGAGGDVTNTGKVIGLLMPKFKGRAEGGIVADVIKEILKQS